MPFYAHRTGCKFLSYCEMYQTSLPQISTPRILTYLRLLCLAQIGTANDRSTVLLTGPAEVSHRPRDNDVAKKMPPDLAERGVCCSPVRERSTSVLVGSPYCSLGGGRWQDLDVISLVPRNATGQKDCVRLTVLGDERDDSLHVLAHKGIRGNAASVSMHSWY